MTTPAHAITDESVTVVLNGRTFTIRKSSPNFDAARMAAFTGKWDEIPGLASPGHAIEEWLAAHSYMGSPSPFAFVDGFITYEGTRIDTDLNGRLKTMAASGANPSGWLKFWSRLQANPSHRSVTQLYAFLTHKGIPIDEETGHILAYKSVSADYKDFHTGTCDNSVGSKLKMPRNQISDDPNEACHFGFHVGALAYALEFGEDGRRIIIVRVDPADVVCVPYDHSAQKVRVCQYEVIGNYSGTPMPDTSTSTRDDVDADDLDDGLRTDEFDKEPDTVIYEDDLTDDITTTEEDKDGPELVADPFGAGTDPVIVEPVVAVINPMSDAEIIDWSGYDKMTGAELSDVSIAILRRYARFGVQIFGASKIPGGKPALIKRILEVRR
jgi:hypothetical protein